MAPTLRILFLAALAGLLLPAPAPVAADEPAPKATKPAPPPPPPPDGEVIQPAPPPALDKRPSKEAALDKDQLEGIEDKKPDQGADDNPYERRAYRYVMLHAREVPADKLRKAAREDITFRMLWTDTQKYRGDLIHIKGRLRMLTPFEAPRLLSKEGIPTIYEGWIFTEDSNNPYCVRFSDLPAGVKTGEKLEYAVSCDAYFFKLYAYQDQKKAWRAAPLFIGHSFALDGVGPAPAETGWSGLSQSFIYAGMAMVVFLVALLVTLNWWFRRGDKVTQDRLAAARQTEFVEPTEPVASPTEDAGNPEFGNAPGQ